jgi:4-amino-4-deoxy-L-arabinose transferase-like glycosyltransferase
VIPSLLAYVINFLERKDKRIIAFVIILYIFAGVTYSFYLGNNFRFLPDESDYYTLASNLAFKGEYSLDGIHLTTYRPPGYPFFLAPFRLLGFDVVGLRILNYFTLGLCIFVLYKMLHEHFSYLAGLLGAFLVVAYPIVFYTAGTLFPQTFASLLVVLTIYFYTRATEWNWDNILAGLMAGWLILTTPTFIFILFVMAGWSWIYQRNRKLIQVALTIVTACLVVGIWSIRNYTIFNTFVFVTSNSGVNLLIGNSENTTPDGDWGIVDITNYEQRAAGLNEIQQDQYYRNQAINYILTHKLASLRMYFLKFLNFFNYHNEFVTKSEVSIIRELLILVTYGPLLLVAIARLVFSRAYKLSSLEILWYTAYLVDALVSAVFVTRIRYREPFDFLLIMIVAVFIDRLIKKRWIKSKSLMAAS